MRSKSTKASFVVFLALALTALSATAQHATLRGFITDGETEQTMQGASVALESVDGRLLGAITDGDGYFFIPRIPAGTYELTVSFVGFESYEEQLKLAAGASVQRSITLHPKDVELDEILVQEDRPGSVTAVVAGLQEVNPAEIARVPVPGVTGDLAGYLQTVPGVVSQGDRGGQYFVRGGALDQNIALLDGLPVYMPFHVLSFYSAFPQEIIDKANVYTGGFGARHGSRISSVIDVDARRGNKQNLAGEFALAPFLSTARVEGPLIRDHLSVIASARESLLEDTIPVLFGQRLPYRFGDRFAKLHAFISPRHSLSVTGLHTTDRGDLAGTTKRFDGEKSAARPTASDTTIVSWGNQVLGGTYTYLPGWLPVMFEVTAGYSAMNNELGSNEATSRRSEIESLDARLDGTVFLSFGQIRFGGSARRSEFSFFLDDQFQDLTTGADELTEMSVYGEFEIRPVGGLSVSPGAYLYRVKEQDRQWVEPRVRAAWQINPRISLNGAWGIYHQATVGLNDRRDVGNIFMLWTSVPRDRDIPEATHSIVGTSVSITRSLSVGAEAFYKEFSNLSVPIFSSFPSFSTRLQHADGDAQGFDVRVDLINQKFWAESVFDGYVSYTNSTVEYVTDQVTYNPGHDRRHQLMAVLHAEKGTLGFTMQWQHGSGLPFTSSGGFDEWFVFTPGVDVREDPGQERVLYNEPFQRRQPVYNRVDLWLERRVENGRTVATIRAGVLNLLDQDNLFYYDLFSLRRVDQLPLTPTVGFKMELR